MDELREVTGSVTVPANTGVEGFVQTIRQLLRKPRLQEVRITGQGVVTFRRYVQDGEEESPSNNFGVDLSALDPYAVVRNGRLEEVHPGDGVIATTAVSMLFDFADRDRMHPLAFATGADTALWDWFLRSTTYVPQARESLYGLPLLTDRQIPDTALLLCAGLSRDANFIDTRVSYKLEIPGYSFPSEDQVDIFS